MWLAVIGLSAVTVVSVLGVLLTSDDKADSSDGLSRSAVQTTGTASSLPPLPPGEPVHSPGSTSLERVTLEEMKTRAIVVFVGTVVDEGGSEIVVPGNDPPGAPALTVHRTRFAVERVLRGSEAQVIELVVPDFLEEPIFRIGQTYLVFAEEREFGGGKVVGLTPSGYPQGAYAVVAPSIARNEADGTVDIERLALEVRE